MKWYLFRQNNSGGRFHTNRRVARFVAIEAPDALTANDLAEDKGLYFDGCKDGLDCSCCGDRWYRADEMYADTFDNPESAAYQTLDWAGGVAADAIVSHLYFLNGEHLIVYANGLREFTHDQGE